jgi:PhnB protein
MTQLDTYLFFDGNCAEAMRFYQEALGGKIEGIMKYGDGPQGCAEAAKDRVMHASLLLGDRRLMASDTPGGPHPHEGNKGFAVAYNVATKADAQRVFAALGAGGKVLMPLEKTFWTEAFGMLTDRFGIPWMIGVAGDANCVQ